MMIKLIAPILILVLSSFNFTYQDDKDLQLLKTTAKNWSESFKSNDNIKILNFYDFAGSYEMMSFLKSWDKYHSMPNYSLTWQIEDAGISKSRDLGYTSGPWQQQISQEGKIIKSSGKYLTIWRKQKDGTWKVIGEKAFQN